MNSEKKTALFIIILFNEIKFEEQCCLLFNNIYHNTTMQMFVIEKVFGING